MTCDSLALRWCGMVGDVLGWMVDRRGETDGWVESGVRSRDKFISWPLAGDSIKSPNGVHTRSATGLKELAVMALASDKSAESPVATSSFVDDMISACWLRAQTRAGRGYAAEEPLGQEMP